MKIIILSCILSCYLDIIIGKPTRKEDTEIIECGKKSTARPLSSVDSDYGADPWHVGIFKNSSNKSYEYICGGTIIHPKYVVTAAHCLINEETYEVDEDHLRIAAGKLKRNWQIKENYQQIVKLKDEFYHENYLGNITNYLADIILVRVDPPFNISEAVAPVCIENSSQVSQIQPTKPVTIVGWSFLQSGTDNSGDLKEATASIISVQECSQKSDDFMGPFERFITKDKFCTVYKDGEGPEVSSGSGLFYEKEGKYFLGGVASIKPEGQNVLVTYTNISQYHDWISHGKSYLNLGIRVIILSSHISD